ncbi:trafficking protein particle complex subunit 9-like isoform X6 [Branchiostoma lanceolatum]|uniref:trafficking protein particle complex subunit 9-like isoform X6 n=1 Tax=Branchiostoma lanceolatum TaxID=7740 RepID=UPI0034518A2F
MSIADYEQTAEDHQAVLVVVKPAGQINAKTFNHIFDRISRCRYVRLPDSQRSFCLRYKKSSPVENNVWGEFQAHRKVMGLLVVGKSATAADTGAVQERYNLLKELYASTLYDSRCLIFGMKQENGTNAKTNMVYYSSVEESFSLDETVREFAASLFWVLESKRLQAERLASDKSEKLPLLLAPFEKKDLIGIDTETRAFRKRCQGRMRKYSGDLCLLAGLTQEALLHYQASADILKSANDWLWLAAAFEGTCAASVTIQYPHGTTRPPMPRNQSFSGSPKVTSERKLTGSLTRAERRSSETLTRTATMSPNGLPMATAEFLQDGKAKNCLSPDEIIEKYKEALIQYSKYKNAAVIELEGIIKATRIMITQRKNLQASEFLQNMVYINIQLTDEDKIQRYNTLSGLYEQIGFKRKAAFFKRVAAMQCVSPNNPNPAWNSCYHLLQETLDGYSLSLDPRQFPREYTYGWPAIQLRILHEMVYTARKMGNPALAVRHMSFLLHAMSDHLTQYERKELSKVLESYTAKVPGTPVPLALESGAILPPVPMTNLPTVKSFKLLDLAPHLRPMKKPSSQASSASLNSPFIYSPIQSRQQEKKDQSKMDFQWVSGEVCEMALQVVNPMPFELKVQNMSVMSEGIVFEPLISNLSLPAESGPLGVTLLGTPKTAGQLKLVGYVTHVLGVKSHCKFKDLRQIEEPDYSVEVVPELPKLQVTTSLPKAAFGTTNHNLGLNKAKETAVTSAAARLYAGESQECVLTLQNVSQIPVESIDISLDTSISSPKVPSGFFTWNLENTKAQLPLQPGAMATFTVLIKAVGEIATHDRKSTENEEPSSRHSSPKKSPQTRPRSMRTAAMTVPPMEAQQPEEEKAQPVDAVLKLTYSGGQGYEDGYHRQASIIVHVDVLQSLLVSKVNILPAPSPRHCHLTLDLHNVTKHEVVISYPDNDDLIIESKQLKRIAVRVERFSLPEPCTSDAPISIISPADVRSQQYSQQLATLVDIRWKMPSSGTCGVVNLEGIPMTPEAIDLISISPIQWDVRIDDKPCDTEEPVQCMMGRPMSVKVSVTNASEAAVEGSTLVVQPYQDLWNGTVRNNVGGKVACVGCRQRDIEKMAPGESFQHTCTFVFFCCGAFSLDIRASCTSRVRPQDHKWVFTPIVRINVQDHDKK